MTVAFNPNSTGTKGCEVFLPRARSFALDSLTRVLGMSLDQSVSQAIGTIKVPISSIPVRGGSYVLEVYDGETGVGGSVGAASTLTARPNEDVSGTGGLSVGWNDGAGGTSNIYALIDESVHDWSDYMAVYGYGAGQVTYAGRMNTAGLSLTSKRVVAVRLCARVAGDTSYANTAQLGLNIGGTDYWGGISAAIGTGVSWPLVSYEWLVNPATGLAWTIADVQSFDSTNEWLIRNGGALYLKVTQAYMEVDVLDVAENRLALGVLDDSASGLTAGAWNTVTMVTPTGGTWTKDGSGRHLYTLRRTSSVGSIVIPLLDAEDGVSFASGWRPTADPTYGFITAMGDERTEIFGLIQRTTAPADSVDSIPYAWQIEALVYTGQDAEQEFSDAGASTYGQVRFFAKPNGTASDLLVKVKKRSDNTQLGATITWTAEDVAALADAESGWKLLDETMASLATLTTATQYYLEFSSSATGVGSDYWSVLAYDTLDTGNALGFGGTTDRATITTTLTDAAAEASRYDLPATISVAPATLSNGDTTLLTLSLTDGLARAVTELEYVRCSWDASALGGSFDRYDIDRSEDGGTSWDRIAKIYNEATEYFDDIEGLRGVAATYRARVVATSGAASAWLTLGTETPTLEAGALAFVTNWELADSLAFKWSADPTPSWQTLDAATLHQPYGLDGSLSFRGSERRFRSFTATIFPVEQLSATGRSGVGVFDPLEDLVAMAIPYVCVHEERGNRWYAEVIIGAQTETFSDRYEQVIGIVELTRTPVPVQLTAVPA